MGQTRILMVDDHPVILDGYKNILESAEIQDNLLIIDTANTSEEAYLKIKNAVLHQAYDVIFLDISLPASIEHNIYSGEDLGLKIREMLPGVKLIVLTMYSENLRLYNIMKNLKPEGFLIKSDFSSDEFLQAYEKVLKGQYYYSHTVKEFIRKQFGNHHLLDDIDRRILYYISKGVKTKDLSTEINLSLAAVEKRKKNIKEKLGVEKGGDIILLDKAKDLGFL